MSIWGTKAVDQPPPPTLPLSALGKAPSRADLGAPGGLLWWGKQGPFHTYSIHLAREFNSGYSQALLFEILLSAILYLFGFLQQSFRFYHVLILAMTKNSTSFLSYMCHSGSLQGTGVIWGEFKEETLYRHMKAEFRETKGTTAQHPVVSNSEEQLLPLGLQGRGEKVVTNTKTGGVWRGPLTRLVAFDRGTKPNHGDLAERKSRKSLSLLTFFRLSYLLSLFLICQTFPEAWVQEG